MSDERTVPLSPLVFIPRPSGTPQNGKIKFKQTETQKPNPCSTKGNNLRQKPKYEKNQSSESKQIGKSDGTGEKGGGQCPLPFPFGSAGPTAASLRHGFAERISFVAVTALFAPILRSGEISFYIHRVWRTLENGSGHCPPDKYRFYG